MSKTAVIRAYLAAVMVVLSFIAYEAFTTPLPTRAPTEQTILHGQVPEAIPGPPPLAAPVEEGEALAYMTIPRFGKDWLWTTLEGTSMDVINKGPGHFTETALPGGRGNSAFAAHRATHGDPFIDFDLLRVGDTVTLAQDGAEWTYTLTMEPRIIEPHEDWVVKPMKHGHWLTLITCWPKYGSEKRMYIRAELTGIE